MKLSVFPLILSAGLAISHVSAAPLRIVVVSSHFSGSDASGFVRVGHAAGEGNGIPNPHHNIATMHAVTKLHMKPKHGCAGSLRNKAMQFSNYFRHVLGLPQIADAHTAPLPPAPGTVNILPVSDISMHRVGSVENHPHMQMHTVHAHHHMRPHTFVQRLTRALMMLGPWEGRAVSFILGCGIGVLIRMVWVLAVLMIRSVRGRPEEEFNEDEVIFEEHEHLLAPPQYVEQQYVVEEKTDAKEAPRAV